MVTDIANTQEYAAGEGTPEGAYLVPFRFDEPVWLIVTVHEDAADDMGIPLSYQSSPPAEGDAGATFTIVTDTSGGGGTLQRYVKPTLPLVAPQWLRITRFTPAKQTLSLTPNAPLPTRQLENALDRLTMALQDRDAQNGTGFDNALLFPADEPAGHPTELPPASQRAGTLLGFDAQTGAIALKEIPELADELIDEKVAELAVKAAELQAAAQANITAHFNSSFLSHFYRHPNGGLKLGFTSITDGSEAAPPGAHSLTIQPGATSASRRAAGEYAIALGYDTSAKGDFAVSIGKSANASAANSVAIGTAAGITGPAAPGDPAGGTSAIAIGPSAIAALPSSVVIGHNATSSGTASDFGGVALGDGAGVTGIHNTAIGFEAAAGGQSTIAIGHEAKTLGTQQVAIGYQSGSDAHAAAHRAVSVGISSIATHQDATAIGQSCTASGQKSAAIGHANLASGDSACAFGISNEAAGPRSSAFGFSNKVLGDQASAFGYDNEVTALADRSTAIGCGVVLNVPDSADIRASTNGPRVFLSGATGTAHLSYKLSDTAPVISTSAWGSETGTNFIPKEMLTFRVNNAKDRLYIHVSVPNGSGGYVLRTAALVLSTSSSPPP